MGITASHARAAPEISRTHPPVRPPPRAIPDADGHDSSHSILHLQAAVAAIVARTHGAATRLLGISQSEDFQALIVHRDATLRRCSELRERRIGLPSIQLQAGSARVDALRCATAALESAGLYHRHVDWVELPRAETRALTLPGAYAAEITALQNGSVDAVYVRGPAGLEAARTAGARVLIDIGAHRDPWVRLHTALLRVVTVSATLLRDHPEVIAQELLQRWPLLPARISLDAPALGALEGLKTFMLRWVFVREDFNVGSWADSQLAGPAAASLVV